MKLQQNTNTVVRSDSFEESNYTIEASAKAFSILSDGLYANKIKAVIRELSTNAYDAHIDAGCPTKPFDIHLPDTFSLYFSIRDYGTGLSHEDCMNLYTTYFGSNKTDTNDAVGCLGLGSKSPFAYTDSFTVISYYHNVKRVYNAFKNEHDQPVFAMLDETETDEPNGIEVKFPVDDDDCWDFNNEAKEVYQHFKVKPNFIDCDAPNIEDIEFTIEGEGKDWGLRKSNAQLGCAIMGQVEYPIDADHFEGQVEVVLRSPINIYFEIGEVDITPSREALSYNQYTKDAIEARVKTILGEISETLTDSFASCETLWEARVKYANLTDSGNLLNRLTGVFDKTDLNWNDQHLWEDGSWNMRVLMPKGMNVKHIYKESWRKTVTNKDTATLDFTSAKELHIYFDDLKRGGIGRCKEALRDLVDVTDRWGDNKHEIYLFRETTIEEACKALGCKPDVFKKTSDLPSVSVSRSHRGGGRSEKRSKAACWNRQFCQWRDEQVDFNEGGYYVEINRYDIVLDGTRSHWVTPDHLVKLIKNHSSNNDHVELIGDGSITEGEWNAAPIYGIKSADVKKENFNAHGQWINLVDLAGSVVTAKYLDDIEPWYKDYVVWKRDSSDEVDKLGEILEHCSNAPQSLIEYVAENKFFSDRQEIKKMYSNACDTLDIEPPVTNSREVKNGVDWEEKHEKVLDSFPLLRMYLDNRDFSRWDKEEYVEFAKYIDMMGEKNEN